ncbi:hypothetical protein GGR55DRAFT_490050 [Xylaria sp. FL0064]|nr:hypothetical protein GGR55DRAFT_490050 [Xylaria sp. FL0064]
MAHHHSFSDDKSSMQPSFNSNVETASTDITQEQTDLAGYPDPFPPQSRDHNPVQSLPFHPKPQSAILTSSLLNVAGRGQSAAVNFGHTEVSQHDLTIPKHDGTEVMNTPEKSDCSVPERSISTKSQDFLALHTVGGMFDQSHDLAIEGSGTFTCTDDSSDDGDLDLKQFADNFLSEKFGISLDRLRRPDRIICAFQQARDQCVDVLKDEGHRFIGSACSEDSQSEPNDGGDTYHDGGSATDPTPSLAVLWPRLGRKDLTIIQRSRTV